MSDILTLAELDEFAARLHATIAYAEIGQGLRSSLEQLLTQFPAAPEAPEAFDEDAYGEGVDEDAYGEGWETIAEFDAGTEAVEYAESPEAFDSGEFEGGRTRYLPVSAEEIFDLLRDAPEGLAIRDFVGALPGRGEKTIRRRVQALEAQGLVVRSGDLRSTRYHSAVPEDAQAAPAAPKRRGRKPAAAAAAQTLPNEVASPAGPKEEALPAPSEPRPQKSDLVDEVRAALSELYSGRPIRAERIAYRLQTAPELVDSVLTLLVSRREAKAIGAPGRRGYVPNRLPGT